MLTRVHLPPVNEALKVLEEGIADRPSDVDLIYIYGYGWPDWRGGPLFWAEEEVGLAPLLATLERYAGAQPNVAHWRPSALLVRLVESKTPLTQWKRVWPDRNGPTQARL